MLKCLQCQSRLEFIFEEEEVVEKPGYDFSVNLGCINVGCSSLFFVLGHVNFNEKSFISIREQELNLKKEFLLYGEWRKVMRSEDGEFNEKVYGYEDYLESKTQATLIYEGDGQFPLICIDTRSRE